MAHTTRRLAFLVLASLMLASFTIPAGTANADQDFKSDIMDFVDSSGIFKAVDIAKSVLSQAASGSFSILNRFKAPLEFRLQEDLGNTAKDMSQMAQAMVAFTGDKAKIIFDKVRSAISGLPDVELGWSFGGGRIKAIKHGTDLSIMAIARQGRSRLVVGVSNADPLCSYGKGRLTNPTPGLPYAFIDITSGPFTSFQARVPLAGGLPMIRASSLVDIGGQMFQVDLSALDLVPTKVKCEIGLGIEATFDDVLMAEAELEGKLCFETEPHKAWAYAKPAMQAMRRASSGMDKKVDASQAASMLYAGLRTLVDIISRSGDDLGEIGVQVELSAKAGAGLADTSATAGTLKAGLGMMVPLGDAVKFSAGMISDMISAGTEALPLIHKFASAGAINNAKAMAELIKALDPICIKLAEGVFRKAVAASSDSKITLELGLDALGEDGGSDSSTAMRMFGFEAEIPAGRSIQTALRPDFIRECIKAIIFMQDQISPKGISGSKSAKEPDWTLLSSVIPKGTTLEIELSPGIPILTLGAKFPLEAMVETMKSSAKSVIDLLKSLPACVKDGSFRPLLSKAGGAFASITGAAISEFKKESKFTMQLGAGFDVSVGAEGASELGLGAKAFIETDLELPCVLAGKQYDTAGKDGKAAIGIVFDFEGEGKVEPGEIVEIEASAGIETSHKLFNVSIVEMDKPVEAADEVMVAGFIVTGYKGTIASTGALVGSGKLHLPIGGTVNATFSTDAAGKVLKGSWRGGFSIAGNSFTVASGTIADDGLHWSAKPNLPFIPATAAIDMKLGPDFEVGGQGTASASLLGISQQYSIGLDLATGKFYGSATQTVKVGPWTFANADFRIDNTGIKGSGDLVMPTGTSTRWNISVGTDGIITGRYNQSFGIAGWTLSQVDLSIGNTQIAGVAYARLPGTSTDIKFDVAISKDLQLIAHGGGTIGYGSWSLANADVSITNKTFAGSASVGIPGNAQISLSLSGTATSFSAGIGQSLSLFGWNLTNSSLTVSSTKISGNAAVSIPSGPSVSLAFNITPTTFSGTVTQDFTMLGWTFTSTKLTLTEASFTAVGKVDLPGASKASVNLNLTPNSVSGSATLASGKLLGWTASAIDLSFSSSSFTGTSKLKLGTTPSVTQQFAVTVTPGHISGSAQVQGPTFFGWSLASGGLTLSDELVTGTLLMTVPGIAQSSYAVNATPTKFEATYLGAVTIFGFNVADANLKINGSTMTGTFDLAVPGLTSTEFTVAASPTKFEATAAGNIKVCDWDVAESSLKMAGTTITGKGKITIVGVSPQFDFTITPAGASGRYEQDLAIPLPGGKSVTLDDAILTLNTSNGMRGTGKLKLSNVTLASADFGITKTGGIQGIAYLGLGGNSVKCDFTIKSSGITLTGSMGASASCTVSVPLLPDPTFSVSATVSVGIQNTNELRLTASGTVDAPVIDPKSVSGNVDLATGKFSVSIPGYTLNFDLF